MKKEHWKGIGLDKAKKKEYRNMKNRTNVERLNKSYIEEKIRRVFKIYVNKNLNKQRLNEANEIEKERECWGNKLCDILTECTQLT